MPRVGHVMLTNSGRCLASNTGRLESLCPGKRNQWVVDEPVLALRPVDAFLAGLKGTEDENSPYHGRSYTAANECGVYLFRLERSQKVAHNRWKLDLTVFETPVTPDGILNFAINSQNPYAIRHAAAKTGISQERIQQLQTLQDSAMECDPQLRALDALTWKIYDMSDPADPGGTIQVSAEDQEELHRLALEVMHHVDGENRLGQKGLNLAHTVLSCDEFPRFLEKSIPIRQAREITWSLLHGWLNSADNEEALTSGSILTAREEITRHLPEFPYSENEILIAITPPDEQGNIEVTNGRQDSEVPDYSIRTISPLERVQYMELGLGD